MVSRMTLVGLIVALTASCGPGVVVSRSGATPISEGFRVVRVGSKREDAPHIFFTVRDRYDYAEVCGAIVASSDEAMSAAEPIIRAGYFIEMAGELILNDLREFARVTPPATAETAEAACIATDVLWRPAFDGAEPVVRLRSGLVPQR